MEFVAIGIVLLLAVAAVIIAVVLTRAAGAREHIVAQTRLAEAERTIVALTAERDAARTAEATAARELAAARQRLQDHSEQLADFARLKEEFLTVTRATVLSTGQELSSKLLADHKRENEAAKLQGEEQVKKAAEHLLKQVEQVTAAVAQLHGRVATDGERIETMMRALSSPSGVGQFAEIGLANTLKSFGLQEGRDFALQHTTSDVETGRRLRPDAVVFLPGNNVLVIDCKASKFLLEIAEAEGTEAEAGAYQNLLRTMNQHLKALADKDYAGAVAAAYRNAGFDDPIARVLSVMYLPNEGAIEKLHAIDPGFTQRAAGVQIIPAGPAGLACIIGFASTEISLSRQIENREQIVETARALLDAVTIVLGHAAGVGRGIKTAAEGFEKLSRSVNRTLLNRARKLAQLGVQPAKPLPGNLPAYQVTTTESDLIDGEAEEIGETPPELTLLMKRAGK
jgi:DNA recombination protein RmuC